MTEHEVLAKWPTLKEFPELETEPPNALAVDFTSLDQPAYEAAVRSLTMRGSDPFGWRGNTIYGRK